MLTRDVRRIASPDFLTVLVAEQSVFTSQDSLAQTERDVALTLVSLYKALGGGWDTALGSGDDTVTASTQQRAYE